MAIVSPASKIAPILVNEAALRLEEEGFDVTIMPHALGESGSYSASAPERLEDITNAIFDDTVDAILCSRGGYGAVHLLEALDRIPAKHFDKWLIGFSDITALHCLWARKGMASLHAAMAKHIGRGSQFECYADELAVLRGGELSYRIAPHPFNVEGTAEGIATGGNMAVLGGLVGTPFDPFETIFTASAHTGSHTWQPILFIEDIGEPIYKVERMLWQLRLRGVFERVAGVLVGRFTEYHPSADHPDMYTMISRFFAELSETSRRAIPVAYNVPMGHIEANRPLLLGRTACIEIKSDGVTIKQN